MRQGETGRLLVSGGREKTCWRDGVLALLIGLLALVACTPTWALDPARTMVQYNHRVFTQRDGAPIGNTSIVQTPDGYIWIGAAHGLYRFDGTRFEHITTLDGQSIANQPVIALVPDRKGGLWIGYGGPGAGYLSPEGKYVAYGADKKWLSLDVGAVDLDGIVWATVTSKLKRIENMQSQDTDKSWGFDGSPVQGIVVDKAGTTWFGTRSAKLFYVKRGERQFHLVKGATGGKLAIGSDGTVWIADAKGLAALTTRNGEPDHYQTVTTTSPMGTLMVDSAGSLIILSEPGLVHVPNPARLLQPGGDALLKADMITQAQGFGGDAILGMIEDRQGNIWVATPQGLDRFRDQAFTPVRFPGERDTMGLAVGPDASVWAMSYARPLFRVSRNGDVQTFKQIGGWLSCVYVDPNGALWVASGNKLWYSKDQANFVDAGYPADLLASGVSSMAMDSAGKLFVPTMPTSMAGSPGHWQPFYSQEVKGAGIRARSMTADAQGRVWIGWGEHLTAIDDGKVVPQLEAAKSQHLVSIDILKWSGPRLWMGGNRGLAVFDGKKTVTLLARGDHPFAGVGGIVEARNGDLWVNGLDQAWHVKAADWQAAIAGNTSSVDVEHFDALDGLDGLADTSSPRPTAVEATDGRIWMANDSGVYWIDPTRPRAAEGRPPLRVTGITADGVATGASEVVRLPPGVHNVEIAYTAFEFAMPERLRFRYRLDRGGDDWTNAGDRRVGYFTDLSPGSHKFVVETSDTRGEWVGNTAVLSFEVLPAWYQTIAFRLACVVLVILMLVAAYRLRIRHVTAELRTAMLREQEERERMMRAKRGERDRIARDLHDTFLQGVEALRWKVQGLSESLPDDDPTRKAMRPTLEMAERVLEEGRDRVLDLRSSAEGGWPRLESLGHLGECNARDWGITFHFDSGPRKYKLNAEVSVDIETLAREAIQNAFKHARATSVKLAIEETPEELLVRVIDDGVGIPEEQLRDGKPGHWGLLGMRERAFALGAVLQIQPGPGNRGTVVELRVPAGAAYMADAEEGLETV